MCFSRIAIDKSVAVRSIRSAGKLAANNCLETVSGSAQAILKYEPVFNNCLLFIFSTSTIRFRSCESNQDPFLLFFFKNPLLVFNTHGFMVISLKVTTSSKLPSLIPRSTSFTNSGDGLPSQSLVPNCLGPTIIRAWSIRKVYPKII